MGIWITNATIPINYSIIIIASSKPYLITFTQIIKCISTRTCVSCN